MKNIDVLIVGQGLVGTVLALKCIEKGMTCMIYDTGEANASKASSGIINPITGRAFLKSKNYDLYRQHFIKTYRDIEVILGSKILHSRIIQRNIPDIKTENDWSIREEVLSNYLDKKMHVSCQDFLDIKSFIAINIKGYQLDINLLLRKAKQFFHKNKQLIQEDFKFDLLNPYENLYESIKARQIVFCEGWKAINILFL